MSSRGGGWGGELSPVVTLPPLTHPHTSLTLNTCRILMCFV
jgi:hypothetical protein